MKTTLYAVAAVLEWIAFVVTRERLPRAIAVALTFIVVARLWGRRRKSTVIKNPPGRWYGQVRFGSNPALAWPEGSGPRFEAPVCCERLNGFGYDKARDQSYTNCPVHGAVYLSRA